MRGCGSQTRVEYVIHVIASSRKFNARTKRDVLRGVLLRVEHPPAKHQGRVADASAGRGIPAHNGPVRTAYRLGAIREHEWQAEADRGPVGNSECWGYIAQIDPIDDLGTLGEPLRLLLDSNEMPIGPLVSKSEVELPVVLLEVGTSVRANHGHAGARHHSPLRPALRGPRQGDKANREHGKENSVSPNLH